MPFPYDPNLWQSNNYALPYGPLNGLRLTKMESALVAANIFANVKDYGATGNGTTDDRLAIQAAITAVNTAGGGVVFFPVGVYNIATTGLTIPGPNITLMGANTFGTVLRRGGNIVLLDASGASSAAHLNNFSLQNMTLDGQQNTTNILPLFRSYYGGGGRYQNVYFYGAGGSAFECVELWDSRFYNCWFDNCSFAGNTQVDKQAVRILSTKESTTVGQFGYSTDSSNNIWMTDCEFTSCIGGDLIISRNAGSNNPNRMFFNNIKIENQQQRRRSWYLDTCVYSSFSNITFHPVSFYSGYSTPVDMMELINASNCRFSYIHHEGGAAIARTLIKVNGGNDNVAFDYVATGGTDPTVATLEYAGTNNDHTLDHIFGTISGAPTRMLGRAIKKKAGIPVDGDFPYVPIDGTQVLDTTNHRLYVRDGGVWKYAALT